MGMTTTVTRDATLRIQAGIALAAQKAPYLATAIYAMKEVASDKVKTLAVDKQWRMYWNPVWVMTLTADEIAAVILHEAGHLIRDHNTRFTALLEPDSRHRQWNAAGDAAINADLREAGIILPKIREWYPENIHGATRDMTTEQMFRLLIDTPASNAQQKQIDLVLIPSAVRYDYTPGEPTILARARNPIFTGPVTIEVSDRMTGEPVPAATSAATVLNKRSANFTLTGTLEPGSYTVSLTCGSETVTAPLAIFTPTIRLRPDYVVKGYSAPYRLVVEGQHTRFDEQTTVDLLDRDGTEVPDAVSDVEFITPGYVAFHLGQVPEGIYQVRVTNGTGEVCLGALPVGLPNLHLTPSSLPSGHGTPYGIAAVVDNTALDASTVLEVLELTPAGMQPLTGATGPLTVKSATSANFQITQTLPDGVYVVTLTTNGETAATQLTVGGESVSTDEEESEGGGSGEGEGQGDGETDEQGDGESDEQGDGQGQGQGKGGSAEGDGDAKGDALPEDCGSGSGGQRRDWESEKGDDTSDGSVSEGRADNIRQSVARQIREHVKNRGTVPGGWMRWAEDLLEPQVDWRKELSAIVRNVAASVAGKVDYTYSRPSRRASAMRNVVLPALRAPRPPEVVEIIDTSGSVSDTMLSQILGESEAIMRQVRGNVRVIACDASAADVQAVRQARQINLAGGGGTDMRVGIEQAAALRPKADAIITLTDGETPWPSEPPKANPTARYIAVLVAGEATYSEVPDWMTKIVIDEAYLRRH